MKSVAQDGLTLPDTARDERPLLAGICIFLALITWAVFGQTLRHDFVNYDDQDYVYANPAVQTGLSLGNVVWAFTHVHANNWHPVTTLSHMLDCQLYGLNPAGHHLTNVLLHTVAVILLFLVLRQMTGALWRSAFVAAVFAVHPLRVESVAWVAERKDVLSGVFFMLTLGAYVRYTRRPGSWGRYALVAVFFALGLMSKPMLVTLPFVLLLLDYWPLMRFPQPDHDPRLFPIPRVLINEKLYLLGLSALSCLATLLAEEHTMGMGLALTLPQQVGNALISCATYIRQMFYPAHLAVFYPLPSAGLPVAQALAALLLLAAVSTAVLRWGKSRPWLPVGWLWYLGMLVPVLGLVQVGSQAHADRYTYLPQIGLYILLTWTAADLCAGLRYRRLVLGTASLTLIAALAFCARVQATYWQDSQSLWGHAVECTEPNIVAYGNLADALMQKGRTREAIVEYQQVLKLLPENPQAQFGLGLAWAREGRVDDAIALFKEALKSYYPPAKSPLNELATILATSPDARLRNGTQAVEFAQQADSLSGGSDPVVLDTLAAAYAEAGRLPEAVQTAQQALTLATEQGNIGLVEALRKKIELYQSGRPYHKVR